MASLPGWSGSSPRKKRPAVVVGRAHHVDDDLDPHQRTGERERRAPLPGAGVGHESPHALLLGVVDLRQRRVELVAARRACALVLEVDLRRRVQLALERVRPVQRRRPPHPVSRGHLVGNADPALERAFLRGQCPRQQSHEVVLGKRLPCLRIEQLVRSARKIRQDVVPAVGDSVDGKVDPLQRCSNPSLSVHRPDRRCCEARSP